MKSITTTEHPPMPMMVLEIEEYSINEWCPTPDGTGPAEQVHVLFKLKGLKPQFVLRFKTRQAIEDFATILLGHADGVWPEDEQKVG